MKKLFVRPASTFKRVLQRQTTNAPNVPAASFRVSRQTASLNVKIGRLEVISIAASRRCIAQATRPTMTRVYTVNQVGLGKERPFEVSSLRCVTWLNCRVPSRPRKFFNNFCFCFFGVLLVTGNYVYVNLQVVGSPVCTACGGGRFGDGLDLSFCAGLCEPGTFAESGASECTACPLGQYSDDSGAGSCNLWTESCPSKFYYTPGNATTDSFCTLCPFGLIQPNNNYTGTSCINETEARQLCTATQYWNADYAVCTNWSVTACEPGLELTVTPSATSDGTSKDALVFLCT